MSSHSTICMLSFDANSCSHSSWGGPQVPCCSSYCQWLYVLQHYVTDTEKKTFLSKGSRSYSFSLSCCPRNWVFPLLTLLKEPRLERRAFQATTRQSTVTGCATDNVTRSVVHTTPFPPGKKKERESFSANWDEPISNFPRGLVFVSTLLSSRKKKGVPNTFITSEDGKRLLV